MLLLQTAFDPEFKAVAAAGVRSANNPSSEVHQLGAGDLRVTVAGRECVVLKTGIGLKPARKSLSAILDRIERPDAVLSIGLAGGLDPRWKVGQSLLIENVSRLDHAPSHSADFDRLASNLRERMSVATLVSLAAPALTVEAKRRLGEQTRADACDMETYAIADVCRQRQIPWLGARVISDAADDHIPAWITTLPHLLEQKKWLRLLARLATHPQDLPRLLRLALRMQRLSHTLTHLTVDLVQHVLST